MSAKPELTDLTCCRALFAAWVFAYHVDLHANFALGRLAGLLHRGYLGVDGFFILSGMILARVHPELERSPSTAWRFWGRRLARIYPVHIVTIAILIGLVLAGGALGLAPRDPNRFGLTALLENVFLVQGWGFGNNWSWNYPSWSLSTEWAGYLLFPALALGLGFCPQIVVGQIAIICFPLLGLIAFASGHGLNVAASAAMLRFLPEFIWGMCAARLVPSFADNLPTASCTIIGFVVALLGALMGLDTLAVAGLWFVLASLCMHGDAERPPLFRNLPFLRALGLLSYSFYMSFAISELLIAQLFRHQGWNPAAEKLSYTGAMTLLTLLLAVILHIVIERPFRHLGERLLADRVPLAVSRLRL
jgi:peptidoglycan/LPS O-acetylase OafA/YrhL